MLQSLFLVSLLLFSAPTKQTVAKSPFKIKNLHTFQDTVWGFDFIDKDRLVLTLKSGEILLHNIKTSKTKTLLKIPNLNDDGQGGALDILVHPSYPEKPWVYVSYSLTKDGDNTTAIARFSLKKESLSDFKNIFVAEPWFSTEHHYGSRMVFDDKGFLFFTVGDRGNRNLAQSLETDNGKVHRIDENGNVPKDNPFYNKKEARKSIWSYGHRNQQGLAFDKKSKLLWVQEHGPRGGDEINHVKKGLNYGWPTITYGREYYGPKIGTTHKKGMEQPYYHYTPSIAPSGFAVYRGQSFPDWQGHFLSGALKLTHLNRLDKNKNEHRYLSNLKKRIRNVRVYNGRVFLSTDDGSLIMLDGVH